MLKKSSHLCNSICVALWIQESLCTWENGGASWLSQDRAMANVSSPCAQKKFSRKGIQLASLWFNCVPSTSIKGCLHTAETGPHEIYLLSTTTSRDNLKSGSNGGRKTGTVQWEDGEWTHFTEEITNNSSQGQKHWTNSVFSVLESHIELQGQRLFHAWYYLQNLPCLPGEKPRDECESESHKDTKTGLQRSYLNCPVLLFRFHLAATRNSAPAMAAAVETPR